MILLVHRFKTVELYLFNRTSHNKRESSFCGLKIICCFHEVTWGRTHKNNQSDIDNCFYSRYPNVLDKYEDYYSQDCKKEFSSFQDKPERIVSVLMNYIYIGKYHLPIFHFIYFVTNHSYWQCQYSVRIRILHYW